MRRTGAAYDAATEETLAAIREGTENGRRMLALPEEIGATLKRVEERGRGP